jgi:hypothetical protein
MRATSPKLRVDEAGEGSLISPEPVGADFAKDVRLLPLLLRFVAEWMLSINGCATVSFESWVACPRTRLFYRCLLRTLELWFLDGFESATSRDFSELHKKNHGQLYGHELGSKCADCDEVERRGEVKDTCDTADGLDSWNPPETGRWICTGEV